MLKNINRQHKNHETTTIGQKDHSIATKSFNEHTASKPIVIVPSKTVLATNHTAILISQSRTTLASNSVKVNVPYRHATDFYARSV